jgi:hypothetical protein
MDAEQNNKNSAAGDTSLGFVRFALSSLMDAGAACFRDPLPRAQELLAAGQKVRAISCFADSKFSAAADALVEVARQEQTGSAASQMALSGLGRIAMRSPEARITALEHLAIVTSTEQRIDRYYAAHVLRDTMKTIRDIDIHEKVTEVLVGKLCNKSADVSGQERWQFADSPRGKNDALAFAIAATGLRDTGSADVLCDVMHTCRDGLLQRRLLEAAAARPKDENLALALRELKRRGDADQTVQMVPGVAVQSGRILERYLGKG